MTTSVVAICNLALGRIGKGAISSLAETSAEAGACNRVYAHVRDLVLRERPWNFAAKRKPLAMLAGESVTDWDYVYTYPSDCLAARKLVQSDRTAKGLPFEVASKSDGLSKVILTDAEDAELLYTKAVTDPNLFDPLFVDALSWKLAVELAFSLRIAKAAVINDALRMYQDAISRAWESSANEGDPGEDAVPDVYAERLG